jgi:hypothetical protein
MTGGAGPFLQIRRHAAGAVAGDHLICPTGGVCENLSMAGRKIFLFFRKWNRSFSPYRSATDKGRTRRHERGAECGGRVDAGGRPASARTAKSYGPVVQCILAFHLATVFWLMP